ncbi:MAG: hypothetical protein M3O85_08785 [Acidobacteriota bacterium]|nr:hypothetical protein [Acidobacteriota bacterium]
MSTSMTASRKLLLGGGLALVLWAMSFGLWYALFVEHQTLEQMGGALATGFAQAAERTMENARASLATYSKTEFDYVRQVDVHSHWGGLAVLLMLLGVAFDRVGFSERVRTALAAMLVAGSFLFPLGVLLQTVDHGAGPKMLGAAGAALVIFGLAAVAVGFARGEAPGQ